jgi:hypothetical protein
VIRPLLIISVLLTAGCAYPVSTTQQGGTDTTLTLSSAPAGARLLVDGADVGDAEQYTGGKFSVNVRPGKHRVAIVLNGETIYSSEVYAGAGANTEIEVR